MTIFVKRNFTTTTDVTFVSYDSFLTLSFAISIELDFFVRTIISNKVCRERIFRREVTLGAAMIYFEGSAPADRGARKHAFLRRALSINDIVMSINSSS